MAIFNMTEGNSVGKFVALGAVVVVLGEQIMQHLAIIVLCWWGSIMLVGKNHVGGEESCRTERIMWLL